jgi:regulator of replication initiation timing
MNQKLAFTLLALAIVASLCINAYQFAGSNPQGTIDLQNQLSAAQLQAGAVKAEKANLQNQIANLTQQITGLQRQIATSNHGNSNLIDENAELQEENANLQQANADLENQLYEQGPRLITKLGATDVKIDNTANHSNQTRLFIEGVVWNIGAKPAENSRLHVILYQGDEVVNNTYIELGTIRGLDCVSVRSDIYYYSGDRLTDWKITAEHT